MEWLLIPAGFIAGFIDSIAGGGGLITVPSFVLLLGHGPHSIGTNKLPATIGVAISFLIYARAGYFKARSAIPFALAVGCASFLGSFITPHVPKTIFPWILLVTCPLVLVVVWKKDVWLKEHPPGSKRIHRGWIYLAGMLVGLYDGLWGPGGGTFMFLALVFLAKIPILESLAASKMANLASGALSLSGYALQGFVHVREGLILAVGFSIGSVLGATLATKDAVKVVRPALTIVVILLLIKVTFELFT